MPRRCSHQQPSKKNRRDHGTPKHACNCITKSTPDRNDPIGGNDAINLRFAPRRVCLASRVWNVRGLPPFLEFDVPLSMIVHGTLSFALAEQTRTNRHTIGFVEKPTSYCRHVRPLKLTFGRLKHFTFGHCVREDNLLSKFKACTRDPTQPLLRLANEEHAFPSFKFDPRVPKLEAQGDRWNLPRSDGAGLMVGNGASKSL